MVAGIVAENSFEFIAAAAGDRGTARVALIAADFDAVGNAIRAISHRGVCGTYTFATPEQTPLSYPNTTDDPEAGQAHLIFQVQDGAHTIISPPTHKQADMRPAPWM